MKKLYILAFLLVSLTMSGQQDPQYTQYMYNMCIESAYAGSKKPYLQVFYIEINGVIVLELQ